jgi:hypothetical protein
MINLILLKTSSGELAHDTHYLYNDYNQYGYYDL